MLVEGSTRFGHFYRGLLDGRVADEISAHQPTVPRPVVESIRRRMGPPTSTARLEVVLQRQLLLRIGKERRRSYLEK